MGAVQKIEMTRSLFLMARWGFLNWKQKKIKTRKPLDGESFILFTVSFY